MFEPRRIVLVMLVAVAASAAESPPGRMLSGLHMPPAGFGLWVGRVGQSDTLAMRITAGGGRQPFAVEGNWRIALPAGLTLLRGELEARGSAAGVFGYRDVLLLCDRWGEFELRGHCLALKDSANWVEHRYAGVIRVTPDSFSFKREWPPPGEVAIRYVRDGVHYRQHGPWWLPLDPGEDEAVEPGFGSDANVQSPPVHHVEAAVRVGAAAGDSTLTVRVWVAVDRSGRVKDAQLVNPNRERGVSLQTKTAALAAAWKWRFAPAHSLGRPVSTIYLIKVPVAAAGGR